MTVGLSSAPPVDVHLPSPPSDGEKYWYLGRQNRWLLWTQAASFALIATSVAKFAIADLRLLLFLAPMSLYAVGLVVSLLSGGRKRRIDRVDHEHRVNAYRPLAYPTVDVFLPTAGESLGILANTYTHVARLDWPADVQVYVLDDGARPQVRELAESFGFNYLTRPNRGFLKKAGNLRYGYEHSAGEHIAIFDADFVPRPDYLHELVPYMEDPETGIVQSPQFFDTTKQMGWLQRCAGATQELFYRWIQPGRDRSRAAICVGTCAVYRRAALVKAGGFAQIGHSEDVHTGVNLMKVGFFTRYVPIIVSKGICPDTMAAFLNQQYRWCTGSMSLMVDQKFHAASHISVRQRLCFWAGFLYYISTGLNAFIAPMPSLVMLYLLPNWIFPKNSVWLTGALALWFVVLPLVYKGRWRIDVLRVQTMYSFAHAVAIVHVLTGRTRDWIATGAAGEAQPKARVTPLATTVSRVMKTYISLTMAAIWVGLVHGAMTYGLHRFWAMIALAVVASYVQVPVLLTKNTAKAKPLPINAPERAHGGPPEPAPATLVPAPRATPDAPHAVAPSPRSFRPDIQGLRAIAVLLVVLYHASVPRITGGYIGVDVFFVISGFLITSQLIREVDRSGRIHFLKFYAGRARRLLPPAAIVVVATLVVSRLYASIFNVKSITTDAIYSAVYALNYRLAAMKVDYQHAGDAVSPLQHLWSLAVEEQFYLAWPLLVMVCVWIGRKRRWTALTVAAVALLATSLYLSVTVTVSNPPYAYFSVHTRAWQLAAGALLAVCAKRLLTVPSWLAVPASWVGVAMIVGSALVYDDSTPFPGSAALVPVVGTMLVIAAGARVRRFGVERVLDIKPMQGLGKVSYGWYLWHWPMVVLIPLMAGYSFGWQYKLEIMALALWFAVLTLYVVENPSLRSRLKKAAWLPAGLAFSATTVVAALLIAGTVPPLVGHGSAVANIVLARADTLHVQEALTRGVEVKDAPANLTPTVVGAAKDQPASSKDGCHADFLNVAQPACVYGDPSGAHTMVLFGDSHAQQWLPALDVEAKALGWKLVAWTKAACPIANMPKIDNSSLGREYTECPAWRFETVKKIVNLNPDVVIISQSDTVPSDKVANTDWGVTTAQEIGIFQGRSIPTAYILDTPFPRSSVPECVATHISNVGACSFTRAKAFLFTGRREAMAQALTSQKITVIDPLDWFCTSTTCPAIVGNTLVYRDGSHMSATWSRWLAPVTKAMFVVKK